MTTEDFREFLFCSRRRAMEDDGASQEEAMANPLLECVREALPRAIQAVESAAKALPQEEDFHFYSNFSEFKLPIDSIRAQVERILKELGSSAHLRSQPSDWPNDNEEAYEWLVGVQDDFLEKIDIALDEVQVEKDGDKRGIPWELDYGKTKGSKRRRDGRKEGEGTGRKDVKIAQKERKSKERLPVPFHVKHISRPQDRFDVMVDNSNTPFKHSPSSANVQYPSDVLKADVSWESNTDGTDSAVRVLELHSRKLGLRCGEALHPPKDTLHNVQVLENSLDNIEPQRPRSLRETPYTFINLLSALQDMAAKLQACEEIAVDLENHHYRSFQGFVCLMQISTRTEDFIIDTLALRSHIGPCLRDIFASPSICKRDFGIYMCNLFDSGQAARALDFPRFGLAFLLEHFCGVHADKRYQLADWRIRPLPSEMTRYAREDTHYLLYMYDLLRKKLISSGSNVSGVGPYIEVCKRSQEICMQLYEKELFDEESHLQLYESSQRLLQPLQLAVFAGLYAWRDSIARKEDESTGYVLPNHLLFHLAEEMPANMQKLLATIKGTHSLIGQHAAYVLDIIRQAKATGAKVPQHALSSQHEMQPEKIRKGASLCKERMDTSTESLFHDVCSSDDRLSNSEYPSLQKPSSPQDLMEDGKGKSLPDADVKSYESANEAPVLSLKLNEVASETGETMIGQSIVPFKIESDPAVVHRANTSVLFKRKPERDRPHLDSPAFSHDPCVPGAGTQQSPVVSGASKPTLATNSELRNKTEIEVSSVSNSLHEKQGYVDDVLRPQKIEGIPPLLWEDSKRDENLTTNSRSMLSACASYETGSCENSTMLIRETSTILKCRNNGEAVHSDLKADKAPISAVVESRNAHNEVKIPMMGRPSGRPSGHLGKMLGVFGGRSQHSNNAYEDKDEIEAKLKAEQIRASVALFFHPFAGPRKEHIDGETENEGGSSNVILGAKRSCEDIPLFAHTLESVNSQSEREAKVEEFISLESSERSVNEEVQLQLNSDNGTCLTDAFSLEEFDINHGESKKHRAWWPCVVEGLQMS
ncbi:hypothetical protein O6H91_17G019500 [Diphasiastrum complanatum]|uniref:Uncharacterized protein n=1 Tax=Diphasiastrum complanatum TaxID=34168 RepID=A0ACC2B4Q6_DIPCM|nr:hypothetical protein O6H91_17G019500 [Diphasiastrum complanatum]